MLFAYRSSQEMEAYAATDRLMTTNFNCPARRCDAHALVELEPALKPGLAGGWYYDHDAHLRPGQAHARVAPNDCPKRRDDS